MLYWFSTYQFSGRNFQIIPAKNIYAFFLVVFECDLKRNEYILVEVIVIDLCFTYAQMPACMNRWWWATICLQTTKAHVHQGTHYQTKCQHMPLCLDGWVKNWWKPIGMKVVTKRKAKQETSYTFSTRTIIIIMTLWLGKKW